MTCSATMPSNGSPCRIRRPARAEYLRFLGSFAVRGFSARYGEALAMDRRGWLTRLLLSEMRKTRMEDA